MKFDNENRRFNAFKEVQLITIPTKNDKLVLDIDGIGTVFEVYDVHFADNEDVEINVIDRGDVTSYYNSSYPDIH